MAEIDPTKACSVCRQILPATTEYFSPTQGRRKPNGYLWKGLRARCRQCQRAGYKTYYTDNKVAVDAKNKQYAQQHPEAMSANTRRWEKRHPDETRVNRINQNTRFRGAIGRITLADLRRLWDAQGGCCLYCGTLLIWSNFETDHKLAISRGGAHEISNLALACPPCNARKHIKTPEEFLAKIECAQSSLPLASTEQARHPLTAPELPPHQEPAQTPLLPFDQGDDDLWHS